MPQDVYSNNDRPDQAIDEAAANQGANVDMGKAQNVVGGAHDRLADVGNSRLGSVASGGTGRVIGMAGGDVGKGVRAAGEASKAAGQTRDKARNASEAGLTGDQAIDNATSKERERQAIEAGKKAGHDGGKKAGKVAGGAAGKAAAQKAATSAAAGSGGLAAPLIPVASAAGWVGGRVAGSQIGKHMGKKMGEDVAKREHAKAEAARTGEAYPASPEKKSKWGLAASAAAAVIFVWLFIGLAGFTVVGAFAYVVLDSKLTQITTGITCFVDDKAGGQSDHCQVRDAIYAALDEEDGLEDQIRDNYTDDFNQTLDCANTPVKDEGREPCIKNTLSQPEEQMAPLPKRISGLIPVYKKAADKYKLPWELLAAVHGARTNFGLNNCFNNVRDEIGYYRFPKELVDGRVLDGQLLVNGGEGYTKKHPGAFGCYDTKPPFKTENFTANSANPYDAVDAIFTEAAILKSRGAAPDKDNKWEYKGEPLTSLGFTKSDGPVYLPPAAPAASLCFKTPSSFGSAMTENQVKFVEAIAQQTGINPIFLGAWVLSEMSGEAAKARERERYYNWLNIGIPGGRAAPAQLKIWNNPESAAKATIEFFDGSGQIKPSEGIIAAMKQIKASKAENIEEAARILGESGWAASGYGSPPGSDLVRVAETTLGGATSSASLSNGDCSGFSSSSGEQSPVEAAATSAQAYAEERKGEAAFAVVDQEGKTFVADNETQKFYGASITKAMIMAAILRQEKKPSPTEKKLLKRMIELSDNQAANNLYERVGTKGVKKVANMAQMNNFDLKVKSDNYVLGASTITALDQAKFFANIWEIIPSNRQKMAKKYMSQIKGDGNFGLVAQSGAYGKTGWNAAEGVAHSGANIQGRGVAVLVGSGPESDRYNKATNSGISKRLLEGGLEESSDAVATTSSTAGTSGNYQKISISGGRSLGNFEATAYGPPWGGIEGGNYGERCSGTAAGVELCQDEQKLAIAVDPRVIPYGSKVKISPNPFNDPNAVFTAVDTGGAIKNKRIDFFIASGREAQNSWGRRSVKVYKVGKGDPKDVAMLDDPTSSATTTGIADLPVRDTCEYYGARQTDSISQALMYRTASTSHSPCYVGVVRAWYEAIVANPNPGALIAGANGDVRNAIVRIALEEAKLGVTEAPPGCNCGPPEKRYQFPAGDPWCAWFATWVWRKAGVDIPHLAGVAQVQAWGEQKKLWKSGVHNNPQPGDFALRGGGHILIVVAVKSKNSVQFVEGNTGASNVNKTDFVDPASRGITGYVAPPAGSALTLPGGKLLWPGGGKIISGFGHRASPGGIGSTNHQGVDITASVGTSVKAAAAGKVVFAGELGGYGNYICVSHEALGITTCYAHNSKLLKSRGQSVRAGEVIAKSGNTGNSTGPHIHFEVREGISYNGKPVDPEKYLPKR